jgi:hypothetical protein
MGDRRRRGKEGVINVGVGGRLAAKTVITRVAVVAEAMGGASFEFSVELGEE